ncbi:MAG: hypoxanthine phosphoribosyltransferase [Puniceicoccales bacterium]|jgi:hypoxanthine phosphoribosyltransferase|nr:hypoxanthine phosphoribosyltransferase [Puniceicoccales bacterium]
MSLAADALKHCALEKHPDVDRVLITCNALATQVHSLGAAISRDYAALGVNEVTVVAIANGAMIFAADLLRSISLHTRFDSIRVSSYLDGTTPSSVPQFRDALHLALEGRHVLVVDDILDTGNTLNRLCGVLQQQAPASLKTCVLLDKKARRKVPFEASYVGFDIPDNFVVGYGLDFAERYRNLPFVGVLKQEKQNPANWV